MTALRHAWASLLTWVPPPFQASLALFIALLLITKLAPRIIRGSGMILQAGWTPMLQLLTYPEYLITILFRHYRWQLLPGTYAYGRVLGTLAPPGTRFGEWLRSRFPKPLRFPRKTTILIIAILASCWYAAPKVPAGGAKTVMSDINTDSARTSSWLATGQWAPAPPPSACPPATTAVNKAQSKKNSKDKTKR